ncbi:MAG TPA: hypothetical protein VFG53_14710 [Anaeromyxobacter sp.]|nr:hypothetical protein [Anaeromyxobacter sp.]
MPPLSRGGTVVRVVPEGPWVSSQVRPSIRADMDTPGAPGMGESSRPGV